MPLFETQTPQDAADLTTHVRNTYVREALQANITRKNWGFVWEGRPLPHVAGANVSVAVESALAVDTTTLEVDGDPAPLATAETPSLIPCNPYGGYVLIAEDAIEQKDMNTLDSKAAALAEHAQKKADLVAGTAAVAGSNVAFVNNRADEDALIATDVLAASHFLRARAFLEGSEAPPFADGYYRAFLSGYAIADLFSDGATAAGFLEQVRYANPEALVNAEVGIWHGFRIYRVAQAAVETNGAATASADLVKSVFCGMHYVGYTERRPSQFIGFKPAGDIMEQMFKALWKGRWGYGIIKEDCGYRVESRSAFAPNP